MSTCRNIVSSEGEKAGLSLYTFDPVSAFGGGLRLMAKTSTAGMSVWLEEDPVHLTASTYKDIASLVQNQAELEVQGKPATGRRRIDSIITSHVPGQCRQCSRCQDGFLAWKMWEAAAAVAVLAEVSSGTAGAAVTATIPTEKGHSFLEW